MPPAAPPTVYVGRPFEGLPSECDLVALRELVPAATAPLTVKDTDRTVLLCSLLPMAAPAMVRDDGDHLARAAGAARLRRPLPRPRRRARSRRWTPRPGVVGLTEPPGEGPRLQDLVADEPLEITVHEGFDYWVADVKDRDADRGRAGAGQRRRPPDRPADSASRRRTGPTSAPRSTCAG